MKGIAQEIYNACRVSADEAVRVVRSGDRILLGSGCSAPQELVRALMRRAPELTDVELVHLLTFGIAPYTESKYDGIFRHNAFFMGGNVRTAVNEGRADYTPVFLSEIPALFTSGQMRLDVAMVTITPPDPMGYCSLGTHVDILKAGMKAADTVIAQVNRFMPVVPSDFMLHVSEIDYFVEHDEPILEVPMKPIDETSLAIARHVASLIPDGATLQLGIGNIPNAVLSLMGSLHDLGIHSEMVSDGVVALCEEGVITNRRKGLHPGKAITSFAMGTRRLYDFLDGNQFWEFRDTAYVNSPRIIAQNHRMVSVNSALQVDLTGQISADSIGTRFYSGFGGQVDFTRGAAMSEGGKPIIALPATASGGTVSRIAPVLHEGAGVVTSRADVHYVVTEYGYAYLHGKSVRERAMALIDIAHPDFRADLRAAAVNRKLVPVEWELPSEALRYPVDMEGMHEFRDKRLFVRPLRAADADRLMEFFYSHEPDTIYGRYQFPKKSMPRKEAIRLCTLDYRREFALAVFGDEAIGDDRHFVAVGRYIMNDRTRFAETAVVVHENYRRLGIAVHLLQQLRKHAERSGILGFYAELGPSNYAPIELHRRLGHTVFFDEEGKVYRYTLKFAEQPEGTDPAAKPRTAAAERRQRSPDEVQSPGS